MPTRPTSLALVIANLLPLAGVLWLDWSLVGLLLIYWAESLLVGLFNILRIVRCRSNGVIGNMLPVPLLNRTASLRYHHLPGVPDAAVKLFLVPFFLVHYGAFCLAYLSVIIGLFSRPGLQQALGTTLPQLWQPSFWWILAGLAVSHLYSYLHNFIGAKEYRRTNPMALMSQPYTRNAVMHVGILLGAGLILWMQTPLPMLVVLVAAKTLVDLHLHDAEHRPGRIRQPL